jgi:hypothetical protein
VKLQPPPLDGEDDEPLELDERMLFHHHLALGGIEGVAFLEPAIDFVHPTRLAQRDGHIAVSLGKVGLSATACR